MQLSTVMEKFYNTSNNKESPCLAALKERNIIPGRENVILSTPLIFIQRSDSETPPIKPNFISMTQDERLEPSLLSKPQAKVSGNSIWAAIN